MKQNLSPGLIKTLFDSILYFNCAANLAIEEKNHSMLSGKMIRVMWSVREPYARKNGVGNVFVKVVLSLP